MRPRPYGLVLAGGGAKGAYQIGAWRAMREIGVDISTVAGVSIGSINGALIASGDYEGAVKLWKSASVVKGVNMARELKEPDNLFSRKNFSVLLREIIRNGGIDASPTQHMLGQYINEDAVRNSNIKLAIVTFLLSEMTPREMNIEDIPEGRLVEYLLASSHYPGVSKIGPEGEKYIDGGIYDNAPVSLMRKLGHNRMIIVDISSIKGLGHKQDISCSDIIYIRPYDIDELGASFDFSDELIEKRFEMGYMDTKKAFGLLAGRIYYFEPETVAGFIEKYGADAFDQLENLAIKVGLPRLKVYGEDDFLRELLPLYKDYKEELEEKKKKKEQRFYRNIIKKNPEIIKKIVALKPTKSYDLAEDILKSLDAPATMNE
ncbi:MAG: patatin-like phospholipase family protein [Clostridiales bacterium]|nr:patatin-like phospholipase family protein [Clostridiales bacterium]